MSDPEQRPTDDCPFSWCTTPHGTTLHPDDEDHRSSGVLVPITTRGTSGPVHTEAEIGLLRRRTDTETWFVVEDGAGVHLELTLASARRLASAIGADAVLRTEVCP